MNIDELKTIEDLFEKAVNLSPIEQTEFIEHERSKNIKVGEALESLISADNINDDLIQSPIYHMVDDLNKKKEDFWINKLVGVYTIKKRIASGGMGTVFLAERSDSVFQQRVAIKIMGIQLLAQDAKQRFESERQILAKLNHSYIATLLDGGTTENGLPFLAMEYIKGKHIDEYCEHNDLSIRERLELFLKICGAVSYLHQHLIVHRDIKPSNIMVDENAMPKLLDFGIAKLIDNDSSLTKTGILALSFDYASPEQVLGREVSITTDVYSLGALFYKMLCGELPHPQDGSTAVERIHTIVHDTPKKPSNVVFEKYNDKRNRTHKSLTGDLDTIALKALHKEADRRYSSVEQLADDIQRYIDNIPIKARGDSQAYHLTKFIQRHSLSVIACVAFILMIIAFTVTTLIQNSRIIEQESKARQEAETSREIANFMTDIFKISDPEESLGNKLTAREVLDKGATKIEHELSDQPIIQARLMHTIGEVYLSIGLRKEAEVLIRKAFTINNNIYGENSVHSIDSFNLLADISRHYGDLDQEVAYLQQALSLTERLPGFGDIQIARQKLSLGRALYLSRKIEDASIQLHEATQIFSMSAGASIKADIIKAKRELILLYCNQGDHQLCEATAEEVVSLTKQFYTRPHTEIIKSLSAATSALVAGNKYQKAKEYMLDTITMRRAIYGDSHVKIAEDLYALGIIYKGLGEYETSISHIRNAIALCDDLIDEVHPLVSGLYNTLSLLAMKIGNYVLAENAASKSLEISIKIYGENSQNVATSYGNQGMFYHLMEQYDKAYIALDKSLNIRRELFGNNHPHTSRSMHYFSLYYFRINELDNAEKYSRKAVLLNENIYGNKHSITITQRAHLARILLSQNNIAEADSLLNESVNDIENQKDVSPRNYTDIHLFMGYLQVQNKNFERAKFYFDIAYPLVEKFYSPRSIVIAEARNKYSLTLSETGYKNEAIDLLKVGLPHIEKFHGKSSRFYQDTKKTLISLGN